MQRCGTPCAIATIPQGESRKNLSSIARLYGEFVKAGLDRKGVVLAVGGGVIGDMAGFAAATYLRGVRCIQAPTTLLAQVDSSVGGKTGVDLPQGKNLVGAFHQPAAVLIDPDSLGTLPLSEIKSGLAEVIKYGIISDEQFFYQTRDELSQIIARNPEALERAIKRSCEIKAEVVCEDETEQGRRAILNFGHTVGHAIETVTNYQVYKHGEAISIGMVSASLIGEELGITPPTVTAAISKCLQQAGLPVAFPEGIPFEEVRRAMLRDKKTQDGKLRFVIAELIGNVKVVDNVSPQLVSAAISRQKPGLL
jgi:3-dehydroquinate synthase